MQDLANTTELTVQIVANYVANNSVAVEELPTLISTIDATLRGLNEPAPEVEVKAETPTAAQIRKSIKPDGLVSFLDGQSYQTLKRHLGKYGLTIAAYKEKFRLPSDYPSTCAEYSARRSAMALSFGLGKARRQVESEAALSAPSPAPAPKSRHTETTKV